MPLALTAAAQALFGAAVARFAPPWLAIACALLGWLLLARRARTIWSDPPRPRWLTRLVDFPLFAHFGASFGGLAFLPFALALVLLWPWPGPRSLLTESAALAYAVALLVSVYALSIGRHRVKLREISVTIPELDAEFDGYRIVQLSDLHIGSVDRLERGLGWARTANALSPDLAVVTGDLVTSGTHYYDDAAEVVGALRARDGTLAILGNHDQWDSPRLTRALESRGVPVLGNRCRIIERGGKKLAIAGLDDSYGGQPDLDLALSACPADAPVILLSHYPSFFAEAAARGVALVLAGHTHGGQIGVPFFSDRLNFARLTGQAPRGLTRLGQSQLYVSAGLGTSGPPLRLGVRAEIVVLVLRCL